MGSVDDLVMVSDREDDASDLLQRALPVSDFPTDFDPNAAPTTAAEYLQQVRYESMKCDKVVTATVDKSILSTQNVIVNVCRKLPAPHGIAPTSDMKEIYIQQFNEIREKLEKIMLGKIPKPAVPLQDWTEEDRNTFENLDEPDFESDEDTDMEDEEEKKDEPDQSNEKMWCKFCFGGNFSDAIFSSNSKKFDVTEAKEPLLSILLNMKTSMLSLLAEWHCDWLKKSGFSSIQCKWLFSLFGCLPIPLQPNTLSALRNIAVWCSKERLNKKSGDPALVHLNSIITIVAHGFNQLDLKD